MLRRSSFFLAVPNMFSVTKIGKEGPTGYKARFYFTSDENSTGVELRYSTQAAIMPLPADKSLFGPALSIRLPITSISRILHVLEGNADTCQYSSRYAAGDFVALPNYEFEFKGKGVPRQQGESADKQQQVKYPESFNFQLDAANAVGLHRFLTASLRAAMFPDAKPQQHQSKPQSRSGSSQSKAFNSKKA